ncbi:MAG TPA: TetR/AcrR family transcriptional regulator [Chthoniobacterales bacterium]
MATKRNGAADERRRQILVAAMACFAKCGFHQTSMHDISEEAGISVGLIYRYFKNKEEVIAALAAEHKRNTAELLARAGQAPTLLEAMEILFTSHCCDRSPQIISAFVLDLFAEARRNSQVARIVRNVMKAKMDGVAKLIARSPEAERIAHRLDPREIAEMIFTVNDGSLMRGPFRASGTSITQQREHQLSTARTLWRLLFNPISNANRSL